MKRRNQDTKQNFPIKIEREASDFLEYYRLSFSDILTIFTLRGVSGTDYKEAFNIEPKFFPKSIKGFRRIFRDYNYDYF